MNYKLVFGSITTLGILLFSTGCSLGNPPQPCNVTINDNHKNITDTEKTKLIEKILKNNSNGYTVERNCLKVNSFWGVGSNVYHDKMKNCFVIDNNKLKRYDYSACYTNGKRHKCDYIGKKVETYADYINKLQNKIIPQEMPKEISKYVNFKKQYLQEKLKAEKKLKSIKTIVIDANNIAPKNILNHIKTQTYIENKYGGTKVWKLGKGTQVIDLNPITYYIKNKPIDFKIISKINGISYLGKNYISKGRYLLVMNTLKQEYSYKNVPKTITFKVKEVYFNFIPNKFIAKDKNIDVIVTYNEKTRWEPMKIKFINKSTNFMEINALAIYYDNKVYDNVLKKPIKLPPKSFKIITIDDLPLVTKDNYIKLVNKNQKVKFGVSVGYKIVNENILKNIYKVNKYSIKDF